VASLPSLGAEESWYCYFDLPLPLFEAGEKAGIRPGSVSRSGKQLKAASAAVSLQSCTVDNYYKRSVRFVVFTVHMHTNYKLLIDCGALHCTAVVYTTRAS
jgi:hypothetical protein